MKALAKRRLIIITGCVLAMIFMAFYFATESEYVASCTFSCSRSSSEVTSEIEKWRVAGYVKKFMGASSIRSLEQAFLKTNSFSRPNVHRAFESCEMKVENSPRFVVTILIRARDGRLAKDVVEFCIKGFADMVNERNLRVFEKHTARARVEIEMARRRGKTVPEAALREIEEVRGCLENENYRVFGIQDVKVRFIGRRWCWSKANER